MQLLCSIGQWCHDTSENLATWNHNPYPGIPNESASGTVIQLKNGRYSCYMHVHITIKYIGSYQ